MPLRGLNRETRWFEHPRTWILGFQMVYQWLGCSLFPRNNFDPAGQQRIKFILQRNFSAAK